MVNLGKNIARLRKLNNITSTELSNIVGIKQPYLSQIENGKRSPSLDVLQSIAKALNTTVSELLGEVPETLPDNMKRLVDTVKDLNNDQIDAIISMVKEMKAGYK
ncbi:MAG TPA: helix-turn-helix transcriptional regulator [Clostridiaceae bacterium]|nr:helix-turn-helix transcriptional regulator [Clostridiaceae bacterium]